MVGGDAALLERVRPVLSAMGTEIFHTGALGSGHATKALNNYLGAAGTVAGFEALLVGEAFGLDPKTLIDVINASTGKNSTTERKIPQQVFTKRLRLRLRARADDQGRRHRGGNRTSHESGNPLPEANPEGLARRAQPAACRGRPYRDLSLPEEPELSISRRSFTASARSRR